MLTNQEGSPSLKHANRAFVRIPAKKLFSRLVKRHPSFREQIIRYNGLNHRRGQLGGQQIFLSKSLLPEWFSGPSGRP